jgi:hypothetical protein
MQKVMQGQSKSGPSSSKITLWSNQKTIRTAMLLKPQPLSIEQSKAGVTLFCFDHHTQRTNHEESFGCPTIEGGGDAFTIMPRIRTIVARSFP